MTKSTDERIARAMAAPGWTGEEELRWLEQAAAGKDLVIEFGAWAGRSTIALLSAEWVVSVDTWAGSPGEAEHAGAIKDGFSPYRAWRENVLPPATAEGTTVTGLCVDLRDPEGEATLVKMYGGKADLVFIDASHDEESVALDIALARRLLKPGGLLCGHDYGGSWTGVKAAVDRLARNPRVVVGSIWMEGE